MKIKVSIQIIFKIMIIVLMIIYLPSYSHQNVKVFKAISTTEALQTSVPVTSSKKIHLYNTHQGEEYVGYNVKEGASYLKDCLTKEGYFCDVEQNDFENYKNIHRIAYNQSYVVSKMYLENSLRENGQYDLVIDFHRDSLDKKYSTLVYNQKSYAKILFVVGKSSGKFDMVNQLSTELSNRANEKVPGLSKGIMVKKNHYNQGICDHTILMKELLIDFTMVGLLLFCMNGLLNNHYIQNEMVSKNIVAFEQNVQKQKEVNSDEGLYDNQKDNTLSLIVKKISQICIQIIQTIVLLISQFISNIL